MFLLFYNIVLIVSHSYECSCQTGSLWLINTCVGKPDLKQGKQAEHSLYPVRDSRHLLRRLRVLRFQGEHQCVWPRRHGHALIRLHPLWISSWNLNHNHFSHFMSSLLRLLPPLSVSSSSPLKMLLPSSSSHRIFLSSFLLSSATLPRTLCSLSSSSPSTSFHTSGRASCPSPLWVEIEIDPCNHQSSTGWSVMLITVAFVDIKTKVLPQVCPNSV